MPSIPKPVKAKKPRKTGERELFAQVWADRPHVCEVCGIAIREPRIHNFDHIETKGRRKDLRLDPSNIRIVCLACHHERHNGGKCTSYIGT
jgi:hypothetical protein